MRAGERYRTRIERETAVRFKESDLFRTARGSFAYPADLAAIAGRPRAKESFGSVKNRRGVPNPIFFIIFVKANEARKSNVKQCTNKPLIKSNKHLLMND